MTLTLSTSRGAECGAIGACSRRAMKRSAPRATGICSTGKCQRRRSRIFERRAKPREDDMQSMMRRLASGLDRVLVGAVVIGVAGFALGVLASGIPAATAGSLGGPMELQDE